MGAPLSLSRRQVVAGAAAMAAIPAAGRAAAARVVAIPYPPDTLRVGRNPAYNEPAAIGETLRIDFADRARLIHLYLPEGDGPRGAILLLHGAKRTGKSMLDMWRAAADRSGVALIAPDALGEGWSPKDDPPQFMIDALNAAARRTPLDPARLAMFGHSSGGLLAQLYANHLKGPWRAVATHGAAVNVRALAAPAAAPTPIRLYNGAKDHLFGPVQCRLTADTLAAAGHPVELVQIADHTHWYYAIGPWLAGDCMDWFAARLAA